MESLSYSFEGRGPLTDDAELYMDDLVRSKNLLGWDAFNGMGFIQPENLVNDANGNSGKSLPSTTEFQTRFPNSAIETNDEKLAQSDLKNKKLVASRKSTCNGVSVENPVLAKRARITNLQSQVPVCIVLGCNKDLSSSKEYHKRHKVCDVHSKTAVVIVNGIQQRFCQQCSRFHILAEFDEGKRSCRKRLTGHNERRRKPKWHNPFGSKIFGMDLLGTSLIYSKLLPDGFLDQQYYEPTNYSKHVKLEDRPSQIHQLSATPLKFCHSLPKSLHEMGKQYPSKNCLNSPLSVLELSAGSNPSCARSLLSAQSQSLFNNPAEISFDPPLIFKDVNHDPAKSTPENFILSAFSSSSGEVDQRVPDAGASRCVGTPENEVSQEFTAREGANTVDLVQLSLHLQRVEQQKYSAPY